jgi:DNA-binding NarL/FixJ family response regulator
MPSSIPIRIIIADDQSLIRSGLASFLMIYDKFQLVGEAQDGDETIQLCELVEPDFVLIELDIPPSGGLEVTQEINRRWPHIKTIVLADDGNENTYRQARKSGAAGFLTKDICADDLAETLFDITQNQAQTKRIQTPTVATTTKDESPSTGKSRGTRPSLTQELVTAGKIQADILPAQAPRITGWDLSATLHPARETSGDFFDFIPLANGNWGIVIADVTDKGMGAALFMTMCSTLMRTYAKQYPTLPALVFNTVNDRILADTRGDLFVTAFYGVLEPDTGRLRYVNAGHNPPFLISKNKGKPVDTLRPTGMALGVVEGAHWGQKMVRFTPGDFLTLYTDGITEAQDNSGGFFGEKRLLQLLRNLHGRGSSELCKDILTQVHNFIGGTHLHDDIALMIISKQ